MMILVVYVPGIRNLCGESLCPVINCFHGRLGQVMEMLRRMLTRRQALKARILLVRFWKNRDILDLLETIANVLER